MKIMKACAKINLTLDILGRRPDNYHELASVMQSINLSDTLVIKKSEQPGITLKCDNPALPVDEGNLVYRVAKYLFFEYNIRQGISIDLHKKIPLAAGIAGGSADCAAALLGINELLELNIPKTKLFEIGRIHGADVPFCMLGGTALAEGIGEKLTILPDHPDIWIVLVRLPILVSTKDIFANWKSNNSQNRSHDMVKALESGDVHKIAASLGNDLESVTTTIHPKIAEVISAFKELDALGVNMSGSGPTVFAYFLTETNARRAIQVIEEEFCYEYKKGKYEKNYNCNTMHILYPDFFITLCRNQRRGEQF